jgi:hypothetical protein
LSAVVDRFEELTDVPAGNGVWTRQGGVLVWEPLGNFATAQMVNDEAGTRADADLAEETARVQADSVLAGTIANHESLTADVHGIADTAALVLTNDARLSDARVPTAHNHDDRYFTETEVTASLAGKSDVGHTHDARYYTEAEVDALLAAKGARNNVSTPAKRGYKTWAFDPVSAALGTASPTKGVAYFQRQMVEEPVTVTTLYLHVSTAGVTLSNCYVAWYDIATLTRIEVSADISAALQTVGMKELAIPSHTFTDDFYTALLIGNGSTTSPVLVIGWQQVPVNGPAVNTNLSFVTSGAAQVALAAQYFSASRANVPWWVATG